jgi:hypothetical protein
LNDLATLQAALQSSGLALPSPATQTAWMWAVGLALCAALVWARD